VKDELTLMSEAVSRFDQPRHYPAACLLAPLLIRATAALDHCQDFPESCVGGRIRSGLNGKPSLSPDGCLRIGLGNGERIEEMLGDTEMPVAAVLCVSEAAQTLFRRGALYSPLLEGHALGCSRRRFVEFDVSLRKTPSATPSVTYEQIAELFCLRALQANGAGLLDIVT
jgi:hypothetical protein